MDMIPYGKQDISESDISAVVEVLQSDFLTQGSAVPAFEASVAEYCGADYAVAVNSATSALHIACLSLGLGNGDALWTSPNTFVASANCALYCGASVDFVDIDSQTYNMSVDALREKLKQAEQSGSLPKIIIPVHFAGQSCDIREIKALSNQYGFKIIEDAAHAIGGKYLDQPIGGCQYSDITIFSFHPVKIITTAEGGMALSNDSCLAKRMQLLRSHGITRKVGDMTDVPDGPWYYQQIELGFNYRMTDMQAALGLSQMRRLDEFVAMRHAVARRYNALLEGNLLCVPWQSPESYSGLHLYVVRLNIKQGCKSHLEVFETMRAHAIGVNLHYIPVYLQPYYSALGFKAGHCPEAEKYYAEAISLPLYPDLSEAQQDRVVAILMDALGK